MVVIGATGFDEAAAAVDVRTLVLLFSMMVIVAHLRLAGGLASVARFAGERVSDPRALLVLLILVTDALSAVFVAQRW
jgi:Na+/H+ antiporter NhaD/arsenite permease-like protein